MYMFIDRLRGQMIRPFVPLAGCHAYGVHMHCRLRSLMHSGYLLNACMKTVSAES